jgi:hypothetical protein
MVEAKQDRTKGKKRKARVNAGGAGHGVEAETGAKQSGQTQANGGRTENLRVAADDLVRRNSERITRLLLNSVADGNVGSAKLLFSLAEQKTAGKDIGDDMGDTEKKRLGLRGAQMLAAEPEWEGTLPEAIANAGRETELCCRADDLSQGWKRETIL